MAPCSTLRSSSRRAWVQRKLRESFSVTIAEFISINWPLSCALASARILQTCPMFLHCRRYLLKGDAELAGLHHKSLNLIAQQLRPFRRAAGSQLRYHSADSGNGLNETGFRQMHDHFVSGVGVDL